METLFDVKENHHSHQSPTVAILAIKNQIAVVKELSMDGILAAIPLGY